MGPLSQSQQRILDFLLQTPDGASLDEIAVHLSVTRTAAKEQVDKLCHFGHLTFRDFRVSVGRPKRRYFLSQEGQELFPKQYAWLSRLLLKFMVHKMGAKAASQMMRQLASDVASSLKSKFAGVTGAELLSKLSLVLNDLGYRAVVRQSDLRKGAIIEASNCVYHSVAKEHPELCEFDIALIKAASGNLDVKLEKCIAKGDSVCRFCLRKPQ